MPIRVSAHCHIGKWHHIEVEDDVTAYLEYENGATGVFIASTGDAPGTNRFEIDLSGGQLVYSENHLTCYKLQEDERQFMYTCKTGMEKPKGDYIPMEIDQENPEHAGVMRNFAGKILHNTPLTADGREGINGLTLSNAIYLSAWTGHMVDIPFDEDLYLRELNKRREKSLKKDHIQDTQF